ncbi:MAG: hypothetical protein QHH17_02510 [Candidatus Bathyarchaeota archaeon]|nr:hypothetical protein [Candidatus Bathyarchaeota archaeon]
MSEEEKKLESVKVSFYACLVLGFLYIVFGRDLVDFYFGIMWIFQAFFSLLRLKFRRGELSRWGEFVEWLTLMVFAVPGFLLGLIFFYPWGIAAGVILGCLVWFVFWRLWIDIYICKNWPAY